MVWILPYCLCKTNIDCWVKDRKVLPKTTLLELCKPFTNDVSQFSQRISTWPAYFIWGLTSAGILQLEIVRTINDSFSKLSCHCEDAHVQNYTLHVYVHPIILVEDAIDHCFSHDYLLNVWNENEPTNRGPILSENHRVRIGSLIQVVTEFVAWLPIHFISVVIKPSYICKVIIRGSNGRTDAYTTIFALYFAWEDLKIARVSTVADRDDWYADQAASRALFATFTLDACVAIMVSICEGAAQKHNWEPEGRTCLCMCCIQWRFQGSGVYTLPAYPRTNKASNK